MPRDRAASGLANNANNSIRSQTTYLVVAAYTFMNFVYALDPATGKVISAFGKNGRIDLREDLGRDPSLQSIALTSPGVGPYLKMLYLSAEDSI